MASPFIRFALVPLRSVRSESAPDRPAGRPARAVTGELRLRLTPPTPRAPVANTSRFAVRVYIIRVETSIYIIRVESRDSAYASSPSRQYVPHRPSVRHSRELASHACRTLRTIVAPGLRVLRVRVASCSPGPGRRGSESPTRCVLRSGPRAVTIARPASDRPGSRCNVRARLSTPRVSTPRVSTPRVSTPRPPPARVSAPVSTPRRRRRPSTALRARRAAARRRPAALMSRLGFAHRSGSSGAPLRGAGPVPRRPASIRGFDPCPLLRRWGLR